MMMYLLPRTVPSQQPSRHRYRSLVLSRLVACGLVTTPVVVAASDQTMAQDQVAVAVASDSTGAASARTAASSVRTGVTPERTTATSERTSAFERALAKSPLTIAQLHIRGNQTIPQEALALNLEDLGITLGAPIHRERLATFRQRIIDHHRYFRQRQADVLITVTPLSQPYLSGRPSSGQPSSGLPSSGQPLGLAMAVIDIEIIEDVEEAQTAQMVQAQLTNRSSGGRRQRLEPWQDHDHYDGYNHNRNKGHHHGYVHDENDTKDKAHDQRHSEHNPQPNENDQRRTLSLGIGYGNHGVRYRGALNLPQFMGTTGVLRLSGLHDDDYTQGEINYLQPKVLGTAHRLGTTLFYEDYQPRHGDTLVAHRDRSYGLSATVDFTLDPRHQLSAGLHLQRHRLNELRPEYSHAIYLAKMGAQQWRLDTTDLSLSLDWQYRHMTDKRNLILGTHLSLHGEISLPGSDHRFYQLGAELAHHHPLSDDHQWTLGVRANVEHLGSIDDYAVPFYRYYVAGGTDTLRGFAYGAVGPKAVYATMPMTSTSSQAQHYQQPHHHVVGGNTLAAVSIELSVPSIYVAQAYRKKIRTTLFVDAANVWQTDSRYGHPLAPHNNDKGRFRISGGIGIHYQSSIGTLSATYAVPIKRYPGDRLQQFQLNLNHHF